MSFLEGNCDEEFATFMVMQGEVCPECGTELCASCGECPMCGTCCVFEDYELEEDAIEDDFPMSLEYDDDDPYAYGEE